MLGCLSVVVVSSSDGLEDCFEQAGAWLFGGHYSISGSSPSSFHSICSVDTGTRMRIVRLEEAADGDIRRKGRTREVHRTWQRQNGVEDPAPGHSYPIASIEKRRESEQLPSVRQRRPSEQDSCNMHKPMCSGSSNFVIYLPEWSAIINLE